MLLTSSLLREASAPKPSWRPVVGRGRTVAFLALGVGIASGAFAPSPFRDFDSKGASAPLDASASEESSSLPSTVGREVRQALLDLEKELERLETASRLIDAQASELLGPPIDDQGRILKLPDKHADLVQYLKQCLTLVENVEQSFGVLVAAKDQVDLQQRISVARAHVQRLEKAGAAGRLARRQIRAWIEKDLQAVESLSADWPAIRTSVQELIEATKQFEAGDVSVEKIAEHHQTVLRSAATRTRFDQSRLGLLCRQTADAADQLHRKRLAQPAVVVHEAPFLSVDSTAKLPQNSSGTSNN